MGTLGKHWKLSEESKRRCGFKNIGRKLTQEHKKKVSIAMTGRKLSGETKEKLRQIQLGRHHSIEARLKMSKSQKKRVLEGRSHLWKGGVMSANEAARTSLEYKLWRETVMRRDKWTCVLCKYRSRKRGDIHADHIKPFALFIELRFVLNNGRTLCVPCHKNTYSFLNNKITINNYQQATF